MTDRAVNPLLAACRLAGVAGLPIIASGCGFAVEPIGCGGALHDFGRVRIVQGAQSRDVKEDPPPLSFLDPGQPIALIWDVDGTTVAPSSRGEFAVSVVARVPADSGGDALCRDLSGGGGSGSPSAPACPAVVFAPAAGQTKDIGVRMDGFLGGHGYQVNLSWQIACGRSVVVDFDFFDRAFEPGNPVVSIVRLP